MPRHALPCFRCGKELVNVDSECTDQPYLGLRLTGEPSYGSLTFPDEEDAEHLVICVCDECILKGGREGRVKRSAVGMEDVSWMPPENVHALMVRNEQMYGSTPPYEATYEELNQETHEL